MIEIIALVIAGFAAWATWRGAVLMQRTSEAQLFLSMRNDYRAPEMDEALKTLRHWADTRWPNFGEVFKVALADKKPEAYKVEAARRHVKGFFTNVLRLREMGYVSPEFLKVAEVDGLDILLDIVRPLELARNPAADVSAINRLEEAIGRRNSGVLMVPPPGTPELSVPERSDFALGVSSFALQRRVQDLVLILDVIVSSDPEHMNRFRQWVQTARHQFELMEKEFAKLTEVSLNASPELRSKASVALVAFQGFTHLVHDLDNALTGEAPNEKDVWRARNSLIEAWRRIYEPLGVISRAFVQKAIDTQPGTPAGSP
jgi:hypothetical protein